jgi:hypothetical protein
MNKSIKVEMKTERELNKEPLVRKQLFKGVWELFKIGEEPYRRKQKLGKKTLVKLVKICYYIKVKYNGAFHYLNKICKNLTFIIELEICVKSLVKKGRLAKSNNSFISNYSYMNKSIA